ncbi:MAG: protease B nonderepressible form [Alyxoria varia]|nr:MAG: protease B nonderepressible form [Alyxoria varia]
MISSKFPSNRLLLDEPSWLFPYLYGDIFSSKLSPPSGLEGECQDKRSSASQTLDDADGWIPTVDLLEHSSNSWKCADMRQRITYIRRHVSEQHGDFDPSRSLQFRKQSLQVQDLKNTAKEHWINVSLDELPGELIDVLEQSHELRIRWTAPTTYDATAPFLGRTTPGLHVYYVPASGSDGIQDSFTRSTPPYHLHSVSSISAGGPIGYGITNICKTHENKACVEAVRSAASASYIDFDYDAISHGVTARAVWEREPLAKKESGWHDEIQVIKEGDTVEVGVLSEEEADGNGEIKLGGWIVNVGGDERANPTLFSFPSRHLQLPSNSAPTTYYTSFDTPTGLHPTMRIHLSNSSSGSSNHAPHPPYPSCVLHAYLTLPSSLFIDRYPLSDPLNLKSHRLTALRSLEGATDLEAPEWDIRQWGSTALFELDTSVDDEYGSKGKAWSATIPLHARYQEPSRSASHANITVPAPAVFWSCPARDVLQASSDESGSNDNKEDGSRKAVPNARDDEVSSNPKFHVNPFDRTTLGYDMLISGGSGAGSPNTHSPSSGRREGGTFYYHLGPQPNDRNFPEGSLAHIAHTNLATHGKHGVVLAGLSIPTLDLRRETGFAKLGRAMGLGGSEVLIEWGTVLAVLLGFGWVMWRLFGPVPEGSSTTATSTSGSKKREETPTVKESSKDK